MNLFTISNFFKYFLTVFFSNFCSPLFSNISQSLFFQKIILHLRKVCLSNFPLKFIFSDLKVWLQNYHFHPSFIHSYPKSSCKDHIKPSYLSIISCQIINYFISRIRSKFFYVKFLYFVLNQQGFDVFNHQDAYLLPTACREMSHGELITVNGNGMKYWRIVTFTWMIFVFFFVAEWKERMKKNKT